MGTFLRKVFSALVSPHYPILHYPRFRQFAVGSSSFATRRRKAGVSDAEQPSPEWHKKIDIPKPKGSIRSKNVFEELRIVPLAESVSKMNMQNPEELSYCCQHSRPIPRSFYISNLFALQLRK